MGRLWIVGMRCIYIEKGSVNINIRKGVQLSLTSSALQ